MLLPQEPVPVGTQFVQFGICFDHNISAAESIIFDTLFHVFPGAEIQGQIIRQYKIQLDLFVFRNLGNCILPVRFQRIGPLKNPVFRHLVHGHLLFHLTFVLSELFSGNMPVSMGAVIDIGDRPIPINDTNIINEISNFKKIFI